MSKTKRHVPQWAVVERRGKSCHVNTWVGISGYDATIDPRSAVYFGRDTKARGYVYFGFPHKGWPENLQGKTKCFFKRKHQKNRRRYFDRMMRDAVEEFSHET